MKDSEIIELYWQRDQGAIKESQFQYGAYCYSIAYSILSNKEDSDECVNDTWVNAWHAIPPQRPKKLSAFLGRITRNLSFNKFKSRKAAKRGGQVIVLVLDELDECIPSMSDTEQAVDYEELRRCINRFLHTLPERESNIFLARYWYTQSVAEIAAHFLMKENNVKASLFRSRTKLKDYLQKEGVYL